MVDPKIPLETSENIIAFSISYFLAECGLKSELPYLPYVTPPRPTLKTMMVELAVDVVLKEKYLFSRHPILLCAIKEKDRHEGQENQTFQS